MSNMQEVFESRLAKLTGIQENKVRNTLVLLNGGATVPFIARYRKEQTNGLDEVQIQSILEESDKLQDLLKRKEAILKAIKERNLLSNELQVKIDKCFISSELEDIYLPYKQKRKTRGDIARSLGLEPLAGSIMKQDISDLDGFAQRFIKGDIQNIEGALKGARDIIAEWVNERASARGTIRQLYAQRAVIHSKVVKSKKEMAEKFKDYFDFSEDLKRCPSHRLLAMRRGETEGLLKITVGVDKEVALDRLERIFISAKNECSDQIKLAIIDSFKRLLAPSIETEFKNNSKEKADKEAIKVFATNLSQLLLAPGLGPIRTLAIDPGFRTGCKVVCLDEHGGLLHNETIYPHPPQSENSKAASKISNLVEAYQLDAIAIGNGTAGRETERFIQKHVRFKRNVKVFIVNESGASIYSASKIAREEFPKFDITVRGSISIGRRLMDPLAELVKIEPKSIGVGQYQHDVSQTLLKHSLDQVVVSAVNKVGVELNTASKHLLSYVSGLGPKVAENIVNYRADNGSFKTREELKNIAGLGPKAFEQSAGFLRIRKGINPLDNSAVHPESYGLVKRIAKSLKMETDEIIGNKEILSKVEGQKFTTDNFGILTVNDILEELAKVGRDVRGSIKAFSFDPKIRKPDDLQVGMQMQGIVSNITNFGAFVDLGVKQDGLVHVSQLADRFVSDPNEIVNLQQVVNVKILEVDISRKRIQLSMKGIN